MTAYRREGNSTVEVRTRGERAKDNTRDQQGKIDCSPTPLVETSDEELAREQVVDCAVAWVACPDGHNARDLRQAVAILRQADGSADPVTAENDSPEEPMSTYQRQVMADYYWGR